MPDNNLTNTLKEARKKAHITQEELADALGVTRQTIIAIEKNRYSPSLTLALTIAQHLNMPIDAIFQLKK